MAAQSCCRDNRPVNRNSLHAVTVGPPSGQCTVPDGLCHCDWVMNHGRRWNCRPAAETSFVGGVDG